MYIIMDKIDLTTIGDSELLKIATTLNGIIDALTAAKILTAPAAPAPAADPAAPAADAPPADAPPAA